MVYCQVSLANIADINDTKMLSILVDSLLQGVMSLYLLISDDDKFVER